MTVIQASGNVGGFGGWHPSKGNVSLQICNLAWQINEVSLGSALIFRELGLASSSFMLKNLLGKAIWSVSGEDKFRIFLGQSNHLAYTSSAPPSWTTWHGPGLKKVLVLESSEIFKKV